MGHRIAVMSEGRLQQVATPEDLYDRPANAFVAHFLGSPGMNLVEGRLVQDVPPGEEWRITFPGASVPIPHLATAEAGRGDADVVFGVRPEALRLSADGPIRAKVVIVEPLGAETHVICHTESGARVIVRQEARAAKPALGEAVRITLDPDPRAYHLFDPATGERLGRAE